jgi:hypothetical protein
MRYSTLVRVKPGLVSCLRAPVFIQLFGIAAQRLNHWWCSFCDTLHSMESDSFIVSSFFPIVLYNSDG